MDPITTAFIDEPVIFRTLEQATTDAAAVREVLAKARQLNGSRPPTWRCWMNVSDPDLLGELFAAAQHVKDTIYGRRLVLFAPLYVSNMCANECTYCAFRARNRAVVRRALSQAEVAEEVRILIDQGHKRTLLVAGESYPHEGFSYVLQCVDTIYGVTHGNGEIRRVNVNVARSPTTSSARWANARSAPTSSSRRRITGRPTRRSISAGRSATTSGA